MLDIQTALQILALLVGWVIASFVMSFLLDWLFSFHEPEEE